MNNGNSSYLSIDPPGAQIGISPSQKQSRFSNGSNIGMIINNNSGDIDKDDDVGSSIDSVSSSDEVSKTMKKLS